MFKISLLPDSIAGDAEAAAMLQTFYSRSHLSIEERLKSLLSGDTATLTEEARTSLHEKLNKYFVGMEHYPVGDNGTITVFFEGVSILCAKAIQDNPLYSGVECSTRYLLFTKENMVNTSGNSEISRIQKEWLDLYKKALPAIVSGIEAEFPFEHQEPIVNLSVYTNVVKARAFDIARSLLPAGSVTSLSFHGSIRVLREHLSSLLCHSLDEVANVAAEALNVLANRYPSSFDRPKYNEEQANWIRRNSNKLHYSPLGEKLEIQKDTRDYDNLLHLSWECRKVTPRWEVHAHSPLKEVVSLLNDRPKGVKVPFSLGRYATFKYSTFIDYGCFRDIQRHRNGRLQIPIITHTHGFHTWYKEQLSKYCPEITPLIHAMYTELRNVKGVSLVNLQYAIPLGTNTPLDATFSLDALVYISELRCQDTVHPILRGVAQDFARKLDDLGIKHYSDMSSLDTFSLKRGKQTLNEGEVK